MRNNATNLVRAALASASLASASLASAALALPQAAWAQTTPAPASTQAPPPAASAPAAGAAAAPAPQTRQQKVEARIADMYATLHITKTQEKQWDRFAQVMLDNAQAMDALVARNAGEAASRNAEQMLQSYDEIAQQHARNVHRLSAAFKTLYAILTVDQKQAADAMFRTAAADREQKQGG